MESKLQHAGFNFLPPSPLVLSVQEGFGAILAKCSCFSCSPTGKVQTTTSTYKYKMQVEEATAPQEPAQDLQNKEDGEEEEKKEEKKEEKEEEKEGEGEETSDPPAEQSASQDTTGEEKQEEAKEATES